MSTRTVNGTLYRNAEEFNAYTRERYRGHRLLDVPDDDEFPVVIIHEDEWEPSCGPTQVTFWYVTREDAAVLMKAFQEEQLKQAMSQLNSLDSSLGRVRPELEEPVLSARGC